MYHEKIIKRPDGSRINIRISLYVDHSSVVYKIMNVYVCKPGKRTFNPVVDTNDYCYRAAGDRDAFCMEKYLDVVTELEIMTAKMELWRNLKPPNTL